MNKLYTYSLIFISFILSTNINAESIKIGFGSCLDQDLPQPIWSAVKNEDVNSFIFLGDNVYGDNEQGNLEKMTQAYETQAKMIPLWLRKKELYYIWDDHDFGVNDG